MQKVLEDHYAPYVICYNQLGYLLGNLAPLDIKGVVETPLK
jgi:hypothetical protein